MSDTPKSFLELDDAPVKVEPNKSVFTNVSSLQVKEGSTAKQDANGTWFNAIGLQSSASHRHVAKVWQDKCTPFADFVSTVKEQSKHKEDIVKKESEIRLLDANTLLDGTPLTKSGLNSLRGFTDIPSSMVSFLQEREYDEELVKFLNKELDRRETTWNHSGKEPRDFRVRVRHDDEGNDVIRAIVSERYGVIDNSEAMDMVVNALPSLKDALASHIFNDGDDIYGNVLLPDYMKSEPDSDYGVGIAFRNSEIRNSTFKISPFLFRAICLNGMIWGRQDAKGEINVNQRHMGKIDLNELQEQVTRYLDSLHEANGHVHENTAFGIVNGLTRASQDYKGSMREQMETQASFILAPSIDSDLQAISKRWGMISERAKLEKEKTINQYAYVAV